MTKPAFFTVSGLNDYVKRLLENETSLRNISLKGELSNFKIHASGLYFTLKDEQATINAVMFTHSLRSLAFKPKDGDEVLITGSITLFAARGSYQILVQTIELFGQGQKLLALEKLKRTLAAEGLFDPARKRPLVRFPQAIGIITGEGSAAESDLRRNLARRYPLAKVYLFPALVQGEKAPLDLLRALALSRTYPLQTLIIARGGGSSEDLSAFNDEGLIRALATYPCPVVAAVGHEIDTTLVDFVADVRVSTPTAAAEAAVPDQNELKQTLMSLEERLVNGLSSKLATFHQQVKVLSTRPVLVNPLASYLEIGERLNRYQTVINFQLREKMRISRDQIAQFADRIGRSMTRLLETNAHRLENAEQRLTALSPQNVLLRGYAYVTDEHGNLISRLEQVQVGQVVKTTLQDGKIMSKIEKKVGPEDE